MATEEQLRLSQELIDLLGLDDIRQGERANGYNLYRVGGLRFGHIGFNARGDYTLYSIRHLDSDDPHGLFPSASTPQQRKCVVLPDDTWTIGRALNVLRASYARS